jgi:hypothetical protein
MQMGSRYFFLEELFFLKIQFQICFNQMTLFSHVAHQFLNINIEEKI